MITASRTRLIAGLALLALVVIACGDDGSSADATTVTLRIHAGTVEVQEGPNAAFAIASDGQLLREGDTVRTGPDGRASVEWFDGSVTRLDFGTLFRIADLRPTGQIGGSRIEAEQESGATFNRVIELTETGSRFSVATPTATAAVQGTTFVIIDNPDGSTTVAVIDGAVVVTTATGAEVVVEAGSMVTVDAAGVVSGPSPIPEELLDGEWIRFNEACDAGDCSVAAVASIEISPADATINVGESQAYAAEGFDAAGAAVGSIEATYEIDGIPCDGATCTPLEPGDYTVTGTHAGLTGTANLIVLATGDIQVTLDWDAAVDLDLWVTDPSGETVMWDHPFAASGGRLDRDAYPDCVFSEVPPENTVWDETAPSGEYLVTVHVYDMCGESAVAFELTIAIGGEVILVVDDVVLTATGDTHEVTFEKP
jgi:hypothetical protein